MLIWRITDEEAEEEDVDIENQYYNSKGNVFSTIVESCFPIFGSGMVESDPEGSTFRILASSWHGAWQGRVGI